MKRFEIWCDCHEGELHRDSDGDGVWVKYEDAQSAIQELSAWRARFPAYVYRPQDDCIALAHEARSKS